MKSPDTVAVAQPSKSVEDLEVRLLLEAVRELTGRDFRGYAATHLLRRLLGCAADEGQASLAGLLDRALHDEDCLQRLTESLTLHVTALFRDPGFWSAFRREAVPLLRAEPFIRVWVAGCATGEEAFSLAILLDEEGLLGRCQIYATDVDETVLAKARHGLVPLGAMQIYTRNHQEAGGTHDLSGYYTANTVHALLCADLRRRICFARHNLATEASFQEFHAILCRNVMIFFGPELQDRVHRLLFASLAPGGVLALGGGETIRFTPHAESYETLDATERLYRRKPAGSLHERNPPL